MLLLSFVPSYHILEMCVHPNNRLADFFREKGINARLSHTTNVPYPVLGSIT